MHTLQRNEQECVVSLNDDLVNGQATLRKMVTTYLEMVYWQQHGWQDYGSLSSCTENEEND